ncbi:MAG: S8 family serine peptidase, partial [Candidatus Baltobacteraceae bacterium]
AKAPIAIVDTGVDVTHPELASGTILRARCFVTYPATAAQTSGPYVTDTDGHGTNVAGIAAARSNNAFGFASTSYDAKILAYRIFPADPSSGCEGSSSPQCESDTADEAAAINDATANGAKVINLSLGSAPPCSTNDPEYAAVENAIAHNVVVVAAAGNGTTGGLAENVLDCPAADPGVI